MDYKEKYKEAMKACKELSDTFDNETLTEELEKIFPELKEGEDEMIRKALIKYYSFDKDGGSHALDNITPKQIIAWLEKQGEIIKEWSEMKTNRIQTELQEMVDLKQKTEQGEQKEATCVAEIIDRLSEKEQEILFKELDMQKDHNKFVESIQIGDKVTRNRDGVLINLSQLKRVAKPADKQGEQKPYASETMNEKEDFDNGFTRMMEKEQKPAKVEPKFHEGDWVVYTGYLLKGSGKEIYVMQVASVEDDRYYFTDTSTLCFDSEKDMRLWTIEDAKDGDVLTTDDGNICVFDGTVEDDKYPFAYCGLTRRRFESYDRRLPFTHNNVHPATKEQRDQLEKAMADAGYTFDFVKKELKKIEQKPADDIERKYNPCYNMSFEEAQEYISNRGFDIPWTGCDVFVDFRYVTQTVANILRWADDNPIQNPAWSEEDELKIDFISKLILGLDQEKYDSQCMKELADWLKSLKDRVQPKQEWSDFDKDILFRTIDSLKFLKDTISKDPKYAVNIINTEREITWLKSIRPQSQWKPSDEQMKALYDSIPENVMEISEREMLLNELYKDLKKLREE